MNFFKVGFLCVVGVALLNAKAFSKSEGLEVSATCTKTKSYGPNCITPDCSHETEELAKEAENCAKEKVKAGCKRLGYSIIKLMKNLSHEDLSNEGFSREFQAGTVDEKRTFVAKYLCTNSPDIKPSKFVFGSSHKKAYFSLETLGIYLSIPLAGRMEAGKDAREQCKEMGFKHYEKLSIERGQDQMDSNGGVWLGFVARYRCYDVQDYKL